ncbi:uncharacterized protein LOC130291274 [Hyla sarda]|uniref:uncharacterized protein LOC130291274 n=1 Tax=Hyla sarda TaxID=327740 RepID=UPI0024C29B90|nr:uncharacterized protein LOC130291274 [Hyla sarda]
MIINMNMGSIDKDIEKESATALYSDLERYTTPEIPAPPPPPPPINTFSDSSRSLFQKCDPKRRSRLRNFNWEAIPLEKVKGRTSLWSSETFQEDLQIDTGKMEELFGKQEEEVLPKPCDRRRSVSIGDACLNKVFLLDSRRSMNIGIFLKQFKRSAAEIVEDIKLGRGDIYSSEKLNELLKQLPDREEEQRLKSFQGDRERLSEADLFMLLLLDLPCYFLHLETLILKKDFYPAVLSLLSAARDLTTAAEELVQCTELHFILKLILKAGNFMNAGGYAGNAAGFRVSSLLKLADTKANKPGMNLLHFVVMEVQKKDPRFLSFLDKLQHVHSASKLSEDGLLEEFYRLQSRITSIHQTLSVPELRELRQQMEEFLEYADHQLQEVQKEIDALQVSRQNLCEFLCEDEDMFHLEECCKVFSCFCQKFQLAIKENKHREQEDQRRKEWEKKRLQKRHSMATCGALEASQSKDELELTLERNLRNTCRPLGRRLCRMRSLGWNNAKPCISYNNQGEQHCDQNSANQMRKISERVLRQQMEYKSQKSINIDSRLYQLPIENNYAACQSERQVSLQKVSLLLSKEKTEIFQVPLETHEYRVLDQPPSHSRSRYSEAQEHRLCNRPRLQNISELFGNSLQQTDTICPSTKESQVFSKSLDSLEGFPEQLLDHHLVVHLLLDAPKSLDEKEINISSHHCTSAPAQESSSSQPTCNSQITQKPIPIDSDFDHKTDQSQTQLNYVGLFTETVPDLSNTQVSKQLIEKNQHDRGPGTEDQSYLQRQMLCLSAPQTFTYPEGLVRLDSPVDEIHTRSVIQSTSESSTQTGTEGDSLTVSNFKEISRNKLRNKNSLQVLDHNHFDQSSDLQGLTSSKQTNELTIVSESSGAPKILKPLTQVISKTMKQTLVKSAVQGTKHSTDLPSTQVSNPSLSPTGFDGSTQSQTANKSETHKLRRTQPGCFMSKIKLVEPFSVKQSFTKETNDYIPPNEKNVDPPNETSRGPQYMGYNSFSKGVKDVQSVVQKDTHNHCSKWKRELRNTSEKANGVKAEPMLENSVRSNRNSLEHKSSNKNSLLGKNGKSIPKKSKMNDLGIRRVPLTKDLAIGSVSPSVIKQPVVTPRHQKDSKDSKIPQKISLSNAGAGKTTPGKNMGTFKEKEGSHVNNNDCGKSESNGSPSISSKHNVPTSLKGDAWTSQISPKKSSSVARVAIHVIKHCEVNSTLTRGTRNTYMDAHPIWR